MIISMTGFGKGSFFANGFEAQVEVRSVNHRFLDLSIKLPKSFESRENKIRELVTKFIQRGRVNINISLRHENGDEVGIKINEDAVKGYKALLEQLRQQAGVKEPIQLAHLLAFSDIFAQDNSVNLPEEAWHCIEKALDLALNDLNTMRKREGQEIEIDLRKRIVLLTTFIQNIETHTEGRTEKEFVRLKQRLENLVNASELDPTRLELEIALLADRVDVTEECTRFKSHNVLFLEAIEQAEPAGRKLNFLLQEMNREANTIGAKASDAEIAHLVVQIKEEVEKLREQVQNLE